MNPEYGHVWRPRYVVPRTGHRIATAAGAGSAPWGWTWIDDARWGFAPFHYGRWAYVRHSLVLGAGSATHPSCTTRRRSSGWVGGPSVSVSLSFGHGRGLVSARAARSVCAVATGTRRAMRAASTSQTPWSTTRRSPAPTPRATLVRDYRHRADANAVTVGELRCHSASASRRTELDAARAGGQVSVPHPPAGDSRAPRAASGEPAGPGDDIAAAGELLARGTLTARIGSVRAAIFAG